jgi:hypothetical protein
MTEEEKKSNKKLKIIIVAYFITIVIIMGMIYSYLVEVERNKSTYHCLMCFEYRGTIIPGVHIIDVVTIEGGPDHEILYELYEVIIIIQGEIDGERIVIANNTINRTTLLEAKNNSYKSNRWDLISYFDIDSNDIITAGDYFTFYAEPSNDVYLRINLVHLNGRLVGSYTLRIE